VAACLDPADGKEVWKQQTAFPGNVHHGFASGSVLVDGKFITKNNMVRSFDAKTGEPGWTVPVKSVVWGTLVVGRVGQDSVVVTASGTMIRVSDGKALTGIDCHAGRDVSSPIIYGGFLYGAWDRNEFRGYRQMKLDPAYTVVSEMSWEKMEKLYNGTGKPRTGWHAFMTSSPIIVDGLLYRVSEGGALAVVDAANIANVVYTRLLDLNPRLSYSGEGGGVAASLIHAGGNIYVFDNSGYCQIIKPGREFASVAVNRVANFDAGIDQAQDKQELFQSTPICDGARIYIRGEQNLYCIGEK
jgi:outer membrane protein assembly factor BamB